VLVLYLTCARCRIRLDREGPEAHLFDRRCPICGKPLEPPGELSELVGFRLFDLANGDPAFADASGDRHRSVARVGEAVSARDAALTPGGLDAKR
jgi:hypothetical protein